MIDFLLSFSLRDLLIFSPESYFKLFELSNSALWPLHIPLGFLVVTALVLSYKRQQNTSQLILIWLGLVWSFVGYWYFEIYYSQISTYSYILSYIFWAEACLFFLYVFFSNHKTINTIELSKTSYKKWQAIIGGGFIFYGLIIHPIVSLTIWNQPFNRFEFFSIAPDPTAITTIGFILLLPVKAKLLLIVIPCFWLLFSTMTYQAF